MIYLIYLYDNNNPLADLKSLNTLKFKFLSFSSFTCMNEYEKPISLVHWQIHLNFVYLQQKLLRKRMLPMVKPFSAAYVCVCKCSLLCNNTWGNKMALYYKFRLITFSLWLLYPENIRNRFTTISYPSSQCRCFNDVGNRKTVSWVDNTWNNHSLAFMYEFLGYCLFTGGRTHASTHTRAHLQQSTISMQLLCKLLPFNLDSKCILTLIRIYHLFCRQILFKISLQIHIIIVYC